MEHGVRPASHGRAFEEIGIAADRDKRQASCLLGMGTQQAEKLLDAFNGRLAFDTLEKEIILVEHDSDWQRCTAERSLEKAVQLGEWAGPEIVSSDTDLPMLKAGYEKATQPLGHVVHRSVENSLTIEPHHEHPGIILIEIAMMDRRK